MLTCNIFWLFLAFIALVQDSRQCDPGITENNCVINPCDGKTCKDAVCKVDNCGGCNRRWYSNEKDVTKRCEFECPPPDECHPSVKVTKCDTNPCDLPLNRCERFPNATCCINFCGGCNYTWFDDGRPIKLCFWLP